MNDLRLAHVADPLSILRPPTAQEPWRVLVSGCLAGWRCGVDGSDYGMGGTAAGLGLPVVWVAFCPEQHGLGTPRSMPDLHGGDGFDVLDGDARVEDEHGVDLTAGMRAGAEEMVRVALAAQVDFAILTDASAACGSQVISRGCRFDVPRQHQRGVGVATASLLRAGIPVVSQRDFRTLGLLRARLDPSFRPDPAAVDHHHHPWVLEHLPTDKTQP